MGALSYKDVLDTLAPARCSFVLYSGDTITGHLNYGTIQTVVTECFSDGFVIPMVVRIVVRQPNDHSVTGLNLVS